MPDIAVFVLALLAMAGVSFGIAWLLVVRPHEATVAAEARVARAAVEQGHETLSRERVLAAPDAALAESIRQARRVISVTSGGAPAKGTVEG